MVGKRGPVVSSHGEVTTLFTQNASWWSQGPCDPGERTQRQSGQLGLQPHFPSCLGLSSWQQLSSTGPSAEHSPVLWPAASPQRPASLAPPLVGAFRLPSPLPRKGTLDPTQCSQAPSHPPTTLSLRHPFAPWEFCQDGAQQPRFGERSNQRVWGKEVRCSEAPAGFQSSTSLREAHPRFCPHPTYPSTPRAGQ